MCTIANYLYSLLDDAAENDKGNKESYRQLMASAAEREAGTDDSNQQTPKKPRHRKTKSQTGLVAS